ncbi:MULTISPECIES: RNA polymerase sigma factor [Paenibacillus]|uniref:RNA polymerase sigma factor n=1 Tax=Paenibacillus TaxID=44249 RepID=UPI00073E6E04|nr:MULTISPECIES: sigma-70 family RNA polymerase sigma factor [Paenibacillus]MDU4698554.1 sigma-70 family RNA polymerase sigma factor [Paenibacillus sp.]
MASRLRCLLAANYLDLPDPVQEEVYYAYLDLVYGTVFYMVKDHQATEDIIQEAFLMVVLKKPAFDNENSLRAWLKTVTRNMAITYLRKNRKHDCTVDSDSAMQEIAATAWHKDSVEGCVETKLLEEAICSYLHHIKPEYRMLFEYRWKQGLSYKEIAERMGVCENLVRQRLYRTREGIKKMLHSEWDEQKPDASL